MDIIINRNAHALTALAHAECSAQFNLIVEIVLANEILQLFNNLTRTLDVAGTADANRDFHCKFLLVLIILIS